MNASASFFVRAAIGYGITCVLAASGFVIANVLLFHGALTGEANGIRYEIYDGIKTLSLFRCLFLAKIVGLIGLPLAFPLVILAQRKKITNIQFFAISGLVIGIIIQAITLWIDASIFSYAHETLKNTAAYNYFFILLVDFLLALLFGLLGGLTYWTIAGKHSGAWKTTP